ncbi:cupredoxin domain-containing protein [Paenibacillus sp. MMS18-CY102]|uniref:cupredoxin domain-containing protein n=1 Tax=Paenibacillus sp. MMS18-CY102 TaxID=2682849 RepID=UPI0013659C90|nr:cupredoxin domain-containing protein [Paenibacillus sp. MMS18-CY102]MWC29009.1 cytochrome C oxidase subunit II [Paenibacillus sp. MMS18-CY102]
MRLRNKLVGSAIVAMLVLIVSACGASSTTLNSNISEPSSATKEVVIEAKSWEFDKTEYRVKKGEAIKLSVKSSSGFHGIKIEDTSYSIQTNESKVLSFDKAGEYNIYCNIACGSGHSKMKAKIIVE